MSLFFCFLVFFFSFFFFFFFFCPPVSKLASAYTNTPQKDPTIFFSSSCVLVTVPLIGQKAPPSFPLPPRLKGDASFSKFVNTPLQLHLDDLSPRFTAERTLRPPTNAVCVSPFFPMKQHFPCCPSISPMQRVLSPPRTTVAGFLFFFSAT